MSTYAPFQPDYQLAYGNNNAAGLTAIESIIPPNDVGFYPLEGWAGYDDGIVNIRQDGLTIISGYPSAVWLFRVMTRAQLRYLYAHYTVGGNSLSGYITVRTMIKDGTFANFNGVILLPKLPDVNRKLSRIRDVNIRFARLVAI